MKKYVFVLLMLALMASMALAQTDSPGTYTVEVIKTVGTDGDTEEVVVTEGEDIVTSDVYFGIFVEDLSFPEARELAYKNLFGVLITKVVDGSPAWEKRLQEDDIIMTVNNMPVTDKVEFDRIRAQLHPGDQVKLRIWRYGEAQDVEMTMAPRPENDVTVKIKDKQTKLSPGYGGGGWIPVWFMPDLTDINDVLGNLGFAPIANSDKGIFMNGGIGKGSVGNGIFIGGIGAGYDYVKHHANADSLQYEDWVKYSLSFGGVTLDKRFPITKNFVSSVGLMIGAGDHEIKITHTDENYTWPDATWPDNSENYDYTITLNREFFVLQPHIELMYSILDWLAIRAEVGYAWGYTSKAGWNVTGLTDTPFDITGSPDTPFQGLTFSVGPWFGF
jgi:hypothetical protein